MATLRHHRGMEVEKKGYRDHQCIVPTLPVLPALGGQGGKETPKTCQASTRVQQPVSTILGSPSCPLNGQHWVYKSWRKEKEELSNPVHLCPWAVALQYLEKKKGPASTVLEEGVVPSTWGWWGGTAFYVLVGRVVTVLPHCLLPLQKMHIF